MAPVRAAAPLAGPARHDPLLPRRPPRPVAPPRTARGPLGPGDPRGRGGVAPAALPPGETGRRPATVERDPRDLRPAGAHVLHGGHRQRMARGWQSAGGLAAATTARTAAPRAARLSDRTAHGRARLRP